MPPRWVVSCPQCMEEFTHTEIRTMANGSMRDLFASPPKTPDSGKRHAIEVPPVREDFYLQGF